MNEKEIENQIIDYLRIQGHYAEGIQSGEIYKEYNGKKYKVTLCTAGTPDIISCIRGKFIGIEVKKDEKEKEKWNKIIDSYENGTLLWNTSAKEKQRVVNQYEQGKLIDRAEGHYWLVSSLEEVKSLIKK